MSTLADPRARACRVNGASIRDGFRGSSLGSLVSLTGMTLYLAPEAGSGKTP